MVIITLLIKLIFKLPDSVKLTLVGGKQRIIAGRTLDLDSQILAQVGARGAQLDKFTPANARKSFSLLVRIIGGSLRKNQMISDRVVGINGAKINLRIYTPNELTDEAPCIIFFHGGGNVIGDLNSYSPFCSAYADECRAKVISVDYRLAPEHKFPTAAMDALAAYQWVRDNAKELNISADNIIVSGDSAGGHLSSLVSIQARDKGIPTPKAQILIYPMTDMRMQTESYELFAKGFVLTKALMQYFNGHYLNSEADKANPLASPLLTEDLGKLPPTVLTLAGFDPLYDEGAAFAEKLKSAGNDIQILEHLNLTHGFITMSGVLRNAELANLEIMRATKNLLSLP